MNIIDFKHAKKTKIHILSEEVVDQTSGHYFINKFAEILTLFENQNDLAALVSLTDFLTELDNHLNEANRLKASAEMLKSMMLQAKASQE
jgi:hypothetical protein